MNRFAIHCSDTVSFYFLFFFGVVKDADDIPLPTVKSSVLRKVVSNSMNNEDIE